MYFFRPKHKSAIWDRTLPTYTSNLIYICAGGSAVTNLQAELNYRDLFKSYYKSSDLGFLCSGGGTGGWGVSGVTNYSPYEFRNVQR